MPSFNNQLHRPVSPGNLSYSSSTLPFEQIREMVNDGLRHYVANCDRGPYVPKASQHAAPPSPGFRNHQTTVAQRPSDSADNTSSPLSAPLGGPSRWEEGRNDTCHPPQGQSTPDDHTWAIRIPSTSFAAFVSPTSHLRVGTTTGRKERAQAAAPYRAPSASRPQKPLNDATRNRQVRVSHPGPTKRHTRNPNIPAESSAEDDTSPDSDSDEDDESMLRRMQTTFIVMGAAAGFIEPCTEQVEQAEPWHISEIF